MDYELTYNPKHVANLLKAIVNSGCEEGFVWYENIGEMPTIFDLNYAINILDAAEPINGKVIFKDEEDDE